MNTFFLLGAVLCLGMFAFLWISTTVLSNASAGIVTSSKDFKRWTDSASFLFWLLVFPSVFAFAATLALVLPAFLRLEPRQTGEKPEAYLIGLAAFSVFLFATLVFRVFQLCWTTARTLRRWQQSADKIDCCDGVPVFRVEIPGSLFAVVGLLRPRIFIGGEALASLEPEELRAAISHEIAHVRAFDNLKRLILGVTRLPIWFSNWHAADSAWAEAAECGADEQTVIRQGISALELSSAIVKIARLQTPGNWSLLAASHLVIPTQPGSMSQRLLRLRLLLENPIATSRRPSQSKLRLLGAIVIAAYLMALPSLLDVTHRGMEWLVR